jgi:hypothetical protein
VGETEKKEDDDDDDDDDAEEGEEEEGEGEGEEGREEDCLSRERNDMRKDERKEPNLSYNMTDFKENGCDHVVREYIPLDEDIIWRRAPVNMGNFELHKRRRIS